MADDTDDPELSWHDKELLKVLRRLANARSQLDLLEAQAGGGTPLDPADVARAEELHDEVLQLRGKSQSRFGGGSARERLVDVEAQERLVLERLGVASYDELQERKKAASGGSDVDPAMLDFARREVTSAEQEWQEVAAMDIPADDVDIDLTVDPPAAS